MGFGWLVKGEDNCWRAGMIVGRDAVAKFLMQTCTCKMQKIG
jgi:hypothetical protein